MDIGYSALVIARGQFAFTMAFHIVLVAFTIGLSSYLVVLEGLWLWTRQQVYVDVYNYWLRIFALNFAVGVVSGVVLEYEVGTNWGGLATRAGPIIGPLMMYEIIVAFFLEAGFLGVMLFGMKKVGKRMHFVATAFVGTGSLLSAAFILSASSWMQTPAGYSIGPDGKFLPTDWWEIIFNPSFPYRFTHMVLAAFLATAFMVGAVGAWHLLRDSRNPHARTMFSMALWMAVLVGPLQMVVGDKHGENTLEHQPQKVAAMEGDWEPRAAGSGEPLILFGVPDMQDGRNLYEVAIPHVASLYLRHDWGGTIKSLKEFPAQDIPNVPLVFFAFRLMVGMALLMVVVGISSLVLRWRGRLYHARWLQWVVVGMAPAGFIAIVAGWTVTEVGRQPFTVYGLMRTAQSSSNIALPGVAWSAATIAVVYFIIFGVGLFYMLYAMSKPPQEGQEGPEPTLTERTGYREAEPGPAE